MERVEALIFERMAALFSYPGARYADAVRNAMDWIPEEASASITLLADAIENFTLAQLEELYIETFDMNPDAALDIGWHLFGEDYARGEFLVKMREENRRYGIDERGELPDNLTVVLHLLAHLPEAEAESFGRQYIAPALRKISEGIKRKDNPYLHLLNALVACLGGPAPTVTTPELRVLKESLHGQL